MNHINQLYQWFCSGRRRAKKIALLTGLIASMLIGQLPVQAEETAADPSIAQDAGTQPEDSAAGLSLSKQVQANPDGTWTVTLESCVTGQEKSGVQPADIVLLLDVSGSMSYFSYDGAATRLDALKKAVNNFIDVVAGMNEKADGTNPIRIAMAQFSSEERSKILCDFTEAAGAGVSVLKAQTAQLTGKGVTRTDCGMGLARQLLEKDKSGKRAKYVVLFTDGQPNDSDGFQPSVANRALVSAESVKQSGAEIYVISIAPNSYAGNGGKLPSYQKAEADDGSDGKFIYVSPSLTYQNGPSVNTTEANVTAMTNRFMHLVSSNNPDASDMDIPDQKNPKNPGRTMAANGTGYYLTALDTEGLADAFHSLAYQIGTSDVYLGTSAQLRDVVTDYFILDQASVRAYTSARVKKADGSFSWGERKAAEGVTVDVLNDQKTVTVKGFDYSGNYISTNGHVDDPSDFGRKLICEFTIRRGKIIGGNHIPTNTGESGVYRNRLLDSCVGRFSIPYVDVPIQYDIASLDYAVYVPDQISLPDMLSYLPEYTPDGQNNAFVEVHYVMRDAAGQNVWAVTIPAGQRADQMSWNWNRPKADHCQKYTIECSVSPIQEGTVRKWNGTVQATAHVFRPTVTLKDTAQARGATADVMIGNSLSSAGLKKHYVKTVWTCDDAFPSKRSNEPKLGFYVSPLSGIENQEGKFVIATDGAAALSVRVYRASSEKLTGEITQYTTFAHTCSEKECAFDSMHTQDGRVKFLIHANGKGSKGETGEADDKGDQDAPDDAGGKDGKAPSGGAEGDVPDDKGQAGDADGKDGKGQAGGTSGKDDNRPEEDADGKGDGLSGDAGGKGGQNPTSGTDGKDDRDPAGDGSGTTGANDNGDDGTGGKEQPGNSGKDLSGNPGGSDQGKSGSGNGSKDSSGEKGNSEGSGSEDSGGSHSGSDSGQKDSGGNTGSKGQDSSVEHDNGSSSDSGSGQENSGGTSGGSSGNSGSGQGNSGGTSGGGSGNSGSGQGNSGGTSGGSSGNSGSGQDGSGTTSGGNGGNGSSGSGSGQAGSYSSGAGNPAGGNTAGNSTAGKTGAVTGQQGMTAEQQAAQAEALRQQQQQALTEAYAAGAAAANSLHAQNNAGKAGGTATGEGGSNSSKPGSVQDRPRTGDARSDLGWSAVLLGACVLIAAYIIIMRSRRQRS